VTKNLNNLGLKNIVENYDLFFIDIWGVLHNGIYFFEDAIKTLDELEKLNKEYVLLSNAPRPNFSVKKFLIKMGIPENISNKVYTSGQASLDYLLKNFKDKKFFHLGPSRDFDLFDSFKINKINEIKKCSYIICTGLFDEHDQDLNYYKKMLNDEINKKMICTNPDLIVDRGEKREYCAGSVAKIFEELGGRVEYFGKPYANVYSQSIKIENKRVLCVGDNLNTDIKGANMQNFSSLLISNGIHKKELENNNQNDLFKQYNVNVDYTQNNLKW
jgi:HAD superfamily hydrolase (TIGR01459 family)